MVSMRSGRPIDMRSTPSLRSFPNVALEICSSNVGLIDDGTNRTQMITINGFQSQPTTVYYMVFPRGPYILFILYTQPLFNLVKEHTVNHHAFADDNQLYKVSTLYETHQSIETI